MVKTLGYSISFLILFYFFLLVEFPYEVIKKKITQSFEESNICKLQIRKVGPSLPFDFYLQDISLNLENWRIQIPDLNIGINIFKSLLGKTDLEIKDLINGQLLWAKYNYAGKEGGVQIRLYNMELKAAYKNDYSFPFRLNGEAKLRWVGAYYERVNGQLWALLQRGKLEVKEERSRPFLLSSFDTLRAEVQIQDSNILVKRLAISGEEKKEIVLKDLNLTDLIRSQSSDLNAIFMGIPPGISSSTPRPESPLLNFPKPK